MTAAPVLWKFLATSSNGEQDRKGELAGGVLYPPAANSDSVTVEEKKQKKKVETSTNDGNQIRSCMLTEIV